MGGANMILFMYSLFTVHIPYSKRGQKENYDILVYGGGIFML